MRDWDSIATLGSYLGMADAGNLAGRMRSIPGAGQLLASIDSAAAVLRAILPEGEVPALLAALDGTDFETLARQEGDRRVLLSADLYRRYAAMSDHRSNRPPFDAFNLYILEYLRRFAASARAILYATGIRKEIISLEHPTVRETVAEFGRLPCRGFGEMKTGEPRPGPIPTSMGRYVQSLLEGRGRGHIQPSDRAKIMEVMDRLSAYPGYFRHVEHERKAGAARPLIDAIAAIQADDAADQEKADLLAALCILLFELLPSPMLVKYLATHRPGTGNRYLQYEYYALLALNFLLMGKRTAAADYCALACETAPDTDMRAYAYALDGCIALERHDYRRAIGMLEKAMDLADSREQRSVVGFYLGVVRYEAGEPGLALNCFREAGQCAESDADVMATHNNMGTCHMMQGNLGEALRAFDEAMSRGKYTGRGSVKAARSVASGNAGIVYMSLREYDLAKEHFANALRDARQTGNARGVADMLMNIGLACKATGEYDTAASHFIAALNYAYTIDYLEGVLYARDQIGQALALQGKHGDEEIVYRDIARRHPGIRNLLR